MSHRNVLCLAIDGLRPDALGAYGDPSGITPGLDRLAAGARLFDFAFSESPELPSFYRGAWQGKHPLRSYNPCKPNGDSKPCDSIIEAASQAGYRTGLITDDPCLVELAEDAGFSDVIEVPCSEAALEARNPEDLDTSIIVEEATNWMLCGKKERKKGAGTFPGKRHLTPFLQKPLCSQEPWLLWIHFGGLTHGWDAIDASADEYTARLESLDLDIDLLRHVFATHGYLDRALTLLVGCRGFPLGEHGEYAFATGSLFEELIHIPLLLGIPGEMGAFERIGQLTCVADLAATLAVWCHLSEEDWSTKDGRNLLARMRGNDLSWREALVLTNQRGETGIRTKDWYLRAPHSGNREDSLQAALYSKPDDRWDANEIGSLCEQVVTELLAHKERLVSRFRS